MADDNNPPAPVPDPRELGGAKGPGNVDTPPAMSLEDINKTTGRNYANIDEALKGIESTYKHVGKPPEVREVVKEVVKVPENVVTREEYQRDMFFASNSEANKNRELIESIMKANGLDAPQKAMETEFYKTTAAKLAVAEETANTRSALTSSPRLGIISDASTKAMEDFDNANKARASGDAVGAARFQREAEKNAVDAVIKATGMSGDRIVD